MALRDWIGLIFLTGSFSKGGLTKPIVQQAEPEFRKIAFANVKYLPRSFRSFKNAKMIRKPSYYKGWTYGQIGTSGLLIARRGKAAVPDYWAIVRVLSTKFGCFMVKKYSRLNVTAFRCRDGRIVAFWKFKLSRWHRYFVKQYDKNGYRINVRKGKLISKNRSERFRFLKYFGQRTGTGGRTH